MNTISTTHIQTLFNDESSYSYSYSFQHVIPNIVGIRIDNIKFNNIDVCTASLVKAGSRVSPQADCTKVMDIYDDTFLAFSIKGEIENGRNLSDIYFLAEDKDYFFNITLKSDVDISKIEFITQLCYKPSSKKPGCDYCSFIKDSKNIVYALYRQPLELSVESPSETVLKNNPNIPTMQINKDDKDDNLTADKDDNLAADTEAPPGADEKDEDEDEDEV
jgi:hypothetical protein